VDERRAAVPERLQPIREHARVDAAGEEQHRILVARLLELAVDDVLQRRDLLTGREVSSLGSRGAHVTSGADHMRNVRRSTWVRKPGTNVRFSL
jgi:hypothetical protein